MVKVTKKMVGECQYTYVGGRQILDATLIANEIVN